MTHTYTLTGMTCEACDYKVKHLLGTVPHISHVDVSREKQTATLTMEQHVAITDLQNALGGKDSKYQISATQHHESVEQAKSWLETYKPILLIFGFITSVTIAIQLTQDTFHFMQWMGHFMAGFFLVFSFFKLLNLSSFAESYAMYDIVAKKFNAWGYIYAFIELGLGFAYLTGFEPILTHSITFVVMSVSIIGVLSSVLNKRQIRCACLGAVFNLPMSTVTIIEDALMILMSLLMLLLELNVIS